MDEKNILKESRLRIPKENTEQDETDSVNEESDTSEGENEETSSSTGKRFTPEEKEQCAKDIMYVCMYVFHIFFLMLIFFVRLVKRLEILDLQKSPNKN